MPRARPPIEPLEARIAPAAVPTVSLSSLDGADGFELGHHAFGDGYAIGRAGDVNGDGLDDILVAAQGEAPLPDGFPVPAGTAWVVFGKSGGFPADLHLSSEDGAQGFRISRAFTSDVRATGAGDVNGDGFDDLLIGGPAAGGPGRVHVVFGKADGWAANLEVDSLDGADGFTVYGSHQSFGSVLSAAGDMNGDGFGDFAIGVEGGFSPTGTEQNGAVYVFFGKGSGFPRAVDALALDGTSGFIISGKKLGSARGQTAGSAGDLNGDGFGDLIVGAPDAEVKGAPTGAAYVVFGKADGFPVRVFTDALDGRAGFQIPGARAGSGAGFSVGAAGDLNGDGIGDVAIGAPGRASDGAPEGGAFVVFGKTGSFPRKLPLSSLDGANGFAIVNEADSGQRLGWSVGAAGDFDGDGIADLVVTGDGEGSSQRTDAAHVIYGASGRFPPKVSVATLQGIDGFHLDREPAASSDASGRGARGIGDVNGDGRDDLLLSQSGSTYVVFGAGHDASLSGDAGRLAIAPDGRSASFVEADGDRVTVAISKGRLRPEHFTLIDAADPAAAPQAVQWIGFDLRGEKAFAKAAITVAAVPGEAGGDSAAMLESLDALGLDLGAVQMAGRLGQIVAGDADPATPALAALRLGALGAEEGSAAPEGVHLLSQINGRVGELVVQGDVRHARLEIIGKAGAVSSLEIAGSLVGGAGRESGSIRAGGHVATLEIAGDVAGGDGVLSGRVSVFSAGAFRIGGDLRGSSGDSSGQLDLGHFGRGQIAGIVRGGGGYGGGSVDASIFGRLSLGALEGGEGTYSGTLHARRAGAVTLTGDLAGGSGSVSGAVLVDYLGRLEVGGSVRGGSGDGSGLVSGYKLGALEVAGDLRGASIGVRTSIGKIDVRGSILGTDERQSVIAVLGREGRPTLAQSFALGDLHVAGNVERASILAGHFGLLGSGNREASIRSVRVDGDWVASNLVAGVDAGPDGMFGAPSPSETSDDFAIEIFGPARKSVSHIAEVIIGGQVRGTEGGSDAFALAALRFGKVTIDGQPVRLSGGLDLRTLSAEGDVSLREVSPRGAVEES